ncbi:precorrin-3B C17-methyltransferase [Rivularia sp. PCC 7116]|uniref:precorrin-3B C(17)-methyltransferase n=1 Tax=Rivularia sp. PCC 7116 TaxID=373994 RepID=UPI00029EC9DC|nr:precorrin-3B C(17)-methyltransferase [Rivularia sp. PCC 7116]AFY59065.1 precorrin-3B C17-methyltransferase [Rivularia sp. PCC 7116]
MLPTEFSPIAFIATTPTGAKKLQTLCQNQDNALWVPESLSEVSNAKIYKDSLKNHLAKLWETHQAFVFCLATGAVVRLISDLLKSKSTDPAVVVIDETGKFVISLCGGHQGGADKLANLIAVQLGATPVLTGASNGLELPAVDILGVTFGWCRGEGDWNAVCAAVARGEDVEVIQEVGSTLWQNNLPKLHPFKFNESPTTKAKIFISHKQYSPPLSPSPPLPLPLINWHPRVLWVGIGCERGTSKQVIADAIDKVFLENQLALSAIAGIATIDIKSDEVGLLELCRERNLPIITFSSKILSTVTVPNPSQVVEKEVGTASVAEAAAIVAANQQSDNASSQNIASLQISKQIYRPSNQNLTGAVTVAIAQSQKEYIGKVGQLLLVGTGPGNLEQMTPAAQTAVASADAVIGYSLYIDLIAPILQKHQIVEALPITKERDRATRAIELANWGLTVAVISSGDSGIYGMAGLVMEDLQASGWDGKSPSVEVFPGVSAFQSAAARVGTPLMHDFCAVSLSDLLTPWEVIVKRLQAAAAADFVTALYNPKSKTRTQQLTEAREIFLKYRNPDTPVAVVRSVYREDEQITITTLEKLLDVPVDMLTTILIGNQSTRSYGEWMITPRGYRK